MRHARDEISTTQEPRRIAPGLEAIMMVSSAELAVALGYSGPTNAFREFCAKMRILPLPGRPGWYDPRLVRRRLDEAQGLFDRPIGAPPLSLVEERKARRGQG